MFMAKKHVERKSSTREKEDTKSKKSDHTRQDIAAKRLPRKVDGAGAKKSDSEKVIQTKTEPRKESDSTKNGTESSVPEKPESPKARRFRHAMPGVLRVLLSIMILVVFSIICTWFILWKGFNNDNEKLTEFITERSGIFYYSCLVIFLFTTTIAAFLWRPFLAMGIVFSLAGALGYANIQKTAVRNVPLLPEDLLMADELGGMESFVNSGDVTTLVIGIVFLLIGCCLLEHFLRRLIGRSKCGLELWDKTALLPRLALGGVSLTALVLLASPVVWHASTEYDFDWVQESIDIVNWSQQETYDRNGFLVGFLYNLSSLHTEAPNEYSQEKIAKIYKKYSKIKNSDTKRRPLSEAIDNLVVVLSESSYDPNIINERYSHSGGDVQPVLNKLFRDYPSGYMYSPEYGGGTANVEFEVFTGLSNAWVDTTPYVTSLAKVDYIPGMTSFAKDHHFTTQAIHSYGGTFYKRNFVYQNMLFDDFRDASGMVYNHHDNESEYINDKSIYQETLSILRQQSSEKNFISLVTMQNHTPQDTAKYPELHFKIVDDSITNWSLVEHYFESLNHADEYLGEFIEGLDKLEGKTVMLWYGDHAAGVLNDYAESDDKRLRDLTHLTPYFIYANFELDDLFTEKEVAEWNKQLGFEFPTKGVDLPTVTPNCLSNILYDVLGVEKPVLAYLTTEVCNNLDSAILANSYQEGELEESEVLKEYELLSYDLIGGKNYWGKLVQEDR